MPATTPVTNSLASMTGFARTEGTHDETQWAWEGRSVNGRGLDVRCRLGSAWDALEGRVRAELAQRFKRGSFTIQLTVRESAPRAALRVNEDLLRHFADIARDLNIDGVAAPRLDGLLALRGVIETAEEDSNTPDEALNQAIWAGFTDLADQLQSARAGEGERLRAVLRDNIDRIAALTAQAEGSAEARIERVRQRLREQVTELIGASAPLTEDRLALELAVLSTKADVREEIDRLRAHTEQAVELIAGGGAIGRRLDFLCQEFNREANTLCSKASDIALTRIGMDLKTEIDQFREQVQNIE